MDPPIYARGGSMSSFQNRYRDIDINIIFCYTGHLRAKSRRRQGFIAEIRYYGCSLWK